MKVEVAQVPALRHQFNPLALACLAQLLLLSSAMAADIRVEVTKVQTPGEVRLALYNQAGFLVKPVQVQTQSALTDRISIVISGVAPGRYAVSAFLDLNANKKLDTNSMGIPSEPYGMSRGAKGKLGPPKFEDAAFDVPDAGASVTIELSKW